MPGSPPTACKLSAGIAPPWGAEGGRFTGPGPRCRLACGTISGTAPGSFGLKPPPRLPPTRAGLRAMAARTPCPRGPAAAGVVSATT